jgi:radical SAM protein with 4Fe4S-binding SPASM domain
LGEHYLRNDSDAIYRSFHPDYKEEIQYFKDNKVYSIQIELNLSCPQKCLYCYLSYDNHPVKELAENDIKTILAAAAKMRVRAIDWLGGDPLLRKDWFKLMSYAMKLGLKNNIWTSGIPLQNPDVAHQAVKVTYGGFISVHLDTLDEHLYKLLHAGDPNIQIKAILNGVENVQAFGKSPDQMFNCITFTKLAVNDVEKTIRYFYEKKEMKTCLTQMCPTGLAKDHPEWIPTKEDIRKACTIRDQINYPTSQFSFGSMDTSKYYCGGMICITVDGDVTPCSVIRKSVGNIHQIPLETIVEKYREELLWLRLRKPQNMLKECLDCKDNEVCWGCRAAAFYDQGNSSGKDPNCIKKIGGYKL